MGTQMQLLNLARISRTLQIKKKKVTQSLKGKTRYDREMSLSQRHTQRHGHEPEGKEIESWSWKPHTLEMTEIAESEQLRKKKKER